MRRVGNAPWVGNHWQIGAGFVWLPLLLIAKILGLGASSADPVEQAACLGPATNFALFGSWLALWLVGYLVYRSSKRYVSEFSALGAAVCVVFCSPALPYSVGVASYGHAPMALATAMMLSYWLKSYGNNTTKRWVTLGALLGLCLMVRIPVSYTHLTLPTILLV